MGAGNSKPSTGHIFSADTPLSLSGELVNSLQKSPQSDSTRSKTLEYQIQSRLTSELERIRAAEASRFQSIADQTSQETSSPAEPSLTEKLTDTLTGGSSQTPQRSHDSVSKEIEELKKKLETRKRLEKLDPEVAKAKDEVVRCLRFNDRKPLDCWQEVEAFKREVARLEAQHLQKTLG